jgi:hypothetical protein
MGKREMSPIGGVEKESLEIQGSDVQGSGRFLFALAKILVDVIDDELQVSDAHKCAGKKVDKVKRVGRVAANVVSKASVAQAKLGRTFCITNVFRVGGCPGHI